MSSYIKQNSTEINRHVRNNTVGSRLFAKLTTMNLTSKSYRTLAYTHKGKSTKES